MVRTKRGSINTQQVMKQLSVGRDGAIGVLRDAKIGDDAYVKAGLVTTAIDDLVEELTGDREALWSPLWVHSHTKQFER